MPPINFNPALLGIGILIVVYLIYAATQARRRRRLQHQLLAASAETSGKGTFKMRHASASRPVAAGKMPAWDGSGILRFTESGLTYEGVEASGMAVRLEIPARETAAMVEVDPSSGGDSAWLETRTAHGEPYYFLPDAESGTSARAILDAVNAHLLERRIGDGPTA